MCDIVGGCSCGVVVFIVVVVFLLFVVVFLSVCCVALSEWCACGGGPSLPFPSVENVVRIEVELNPSERAQKGQNKDEEAMMDNKKGR